MERIFECFKFCRRGAMQSLWLTVKCRQICRSPERLHSFRTIFLVPSNMISYLMSRLSVLYPLWRAKSISLDMINDSSMSFGQTICCISSRHLKYWYTIQASTGIPWWEDGNIPLHVNYIFTMSYIAIANSYNSAPCLRSWKKSNIWYLEVICQILPSHLRFAGNISCVFKNAVK